MYNRLRRAWRSVADLASATDFDREDLMIVLGLACFGAGVWMVSRPAALIAVGAVLLWAFLPSRPPFVERPVVKPERRT